MTTGMQDPTSKHPAGEQPGQTQEAPGSQEAMTPTPEAGEDSYVGHGRLTGRRALITGADSGIGRAVAIAFAREGADVGLSFMPEEAEDGDRTAELVREAGRTALLLPGDVRDERYDEEIVARVVAELGGLDLLVLNAAFQHHIEGIETLQTDDMMRVFETNLVAPLVTTRAAVPHLRPGASIIVTASVQASQPSPNLVDYAMTKAAQVAFVKAMAEELGPRGIRVNGVAPGPIWTPLIPATGWGEERVATFGQDTPLGRAGQPAELAGAYVYLASEDASYTSGSIVPVTGGRAIF